MRVVCHVPSSDAVGGQLCRGGSRMPGLAHQPGRCRTVGIEIGIGVGLLCSACSCNAWELGADFCVGIVKESMNVSISLDGKATVSDVLGTALRSNAARTVRLSPKIPESPYTGQRV